MARQLFELVGTDAARPFSPFCWRIRMALAHKGLEADTVPWRFTERSVLAPHHSEKVPVLIDGDVSVHDSWTIANYLEDTYPDKPSLFGGDGGRAMARMLNWWGDIAIVGGVFPLIAADIITLLPAEDAAYFRKTRESRLGGGTPEDAAAKRDVTVTAFRKSLDPLRLTLRSQPFIGGTAANYADYIVFGGFQWARVVSPFALLAQDDLVYAWREKMLDAFGGLARATPGYPV